VDEQAEPSLPHPPKPPHAATALVMLCQGHPSAVFGRDEDPYI
jgi:hypothetical protein